MDGLLLWEEEGNQKRNEKEISKLKIYRLDGVGIFFYCNNRVFQTPLPKSGKLRLVFSIWVKIKGRLIRKRQ